MKVQRTPVLEVTLAFASAVKRAAEPAPMTCTQEVAPAGSLQTVKYGEMAAYRNAK